MRINAPLPLITAVLLAALAVGVAIGSAVVYSYGVQQLHTEAPR